MISLLAEGWRFVPHSYAFVNQWQCLELMKRPDERAVVEKAHRRPRFVEDCVREMLRGVAAAYPDLDPSAFVMARQENLETIHQHNVVAERYGLFGEIIAELCSGRHSPHHVTMREWLESPSQSHG